MKLKKSFSLIDYWNILIIRKTTIIIASLATGIITAFIVYFVMDLIFMSTASVKSSSKGAGLAGLLQGGGAIPDLGEFTDFAGSSSTKELALYEYILTSRRNAEETIVKFQLNEEWKFKYLEDAVKNFRKGVIEIAKDKIAGTMEISIFDKDPQRAKDMVMFQIENLNKINTELNVTNARNNRKFIEERFNLIKEDLRKAEDSLKSFQDEFGVAPDIRIKAVSQIEIELETQLKSEQIKLELLKKIISPEQSEVKSQEEKIKALRSQINEMNTNQSGKGNINLKGSPDIAISYLRLVRNLEIQNKLLTFMIPLYEQAKIDENRETPSVLVIDQPVVPERKVKPKRATLTLLFMVAAFLGSFAYFVMLEKYKIFRSELHSDQS